MNILSIFGKLGSSVAGIFTGGAASGITKYAIIGVAFLGIIAYHYYEVASYTNSISQLQSVNATLQSNMTALKNSNDSLKNEVVAAQANQALLTQEINSIHTVDTNSGDLLDDIILNTLDNAQLLAQVQERNSPTTANKFLDTANSNINCIFDNFGNDETGSCENGVFKIYNTDSPMGNTPPVNSVNPSATTVPTK